MRCSYDICQKPPIVRTYCEQHFLMQFVQPLQKERRNIESALAILNSNIKEFVDELGLARAAARGIDKPERFLRERPQGGWTNSGTVFCHKCYKAFDSGIDVLQHEESCTGLERRAKPGAKRESKPIVVKAVIIDESDFTSDV